MLGVPKKSMTIRRPLIIKDEILTGRQVNRNKEELEDTLKMQEIQEEQKKNVLAGIDKLVKTLLKSKIISL